MKTFPPKSPYSGEPEDRRGTRTYRRYMNSLVCNSTGRTVLLRCTRRQEKKAWRLVDAGTPTQRVQGRILRVIMRSMWNEVGAECDSRIYGGP